MTGFRNNPDPLVAALKKAGFRLTQSRVINVRTGERWLHRRVIRRATQVVTTTKTL